MGPQKRLRARLKTIILVGHGSKLAGFDRPMRRLKRALERGGAVMVRNAFLEINQPSIPEAVASAVRGGSSDIRIVPYFLLAGRHTAHDIPAIVKAARAEHPKARIRLCPYLGFDDSLVRLVKKRAGVRS